MTPVLSSASMALCFLIVVTEVARGEPVINEFLASNQQGLLDEDGEASDWIELHNPTDVPIELGGYALTDDPALANKWTFPNLSISPGSYLTVFASGKDRRVAGSALHTNFSLEESGEYLALYSPDGTALSRYAPEFPNQRSDVSYGASGVEGDQQGYLLNPTPGSVNGVAFQGFVRDTQFSLDRGYYEEPFELEITSMTESAVIRYTIDGTEPTEASAMEYTEPIQISETTIVRALASKDGFASSNIDTQTYLFVRDVKTQATMDARVTENPAYEEEMEEALRALPALSIVAESARLFGRNGIYSQYERSGRGAEVPISLEYFSANDPEDVFHIAAGLRIHGGNARSHPKKPFRLYFREEYSGGSGELEHQLYPESNVHQFEQLVLRGGGHDSWSLADAFGGTDFDLPAHGTLLRDQFIRKTENEMGLLSPIGKYVHVYLNGVYWGIYDMHERPNATYFSDHLGGKKSDWDVVHHPEFADETYSVVSGDAERWESLQSIADARVADGAGFERMQSLVNLETYIDSIIVRMWSGDFDWVGPIYVSVEQDGISRFRDVTVFGNKNWYAGSHTRGGGDGRFHFFSWDAEMSMGLHLLYNIFGDTAQRRLDFDLSRANDPGSPVAPYDALIRYGPFQREFADRLNRHLFNGGLLSPQKAQARLQAMIETLRAPIIAESARWGNTASNGRLFTRDDDWLPEVEWLRDTFMVERPEEMLNGFRTRDIYPIPMAPVLEKHGGYLAEGERIAISTESVGDSAIYYTIDGSDPAEFPEIETIEALSEGTPCQWLIPNPTNGGFSPNFNWRLLAGKSSASFWWNGRVGLGFDMEDDHFEDFFQTDVGSIFQSTGGSTLFCRVPFGIPSQAALENMEALILRMRYDDGFVAYINGAEVASANAPDFVSARSAAVNVRADADAVFEEAFDVTDRARPYLRVGSNMLAIQGLNSPDGGDDFLLAPRMELQRQISPGGPAATARKAGDSIELKASALLKARTLDEFGRWSALTEHYFYLEPELAPGDLAISEIHYRPLPPQHEGEWAVADARNEFEFLELRNMREGAVELGGAQFTRGIRFIFPPRSLAPGERVLLVRNQAAFEARYGVDTAALVVGEFERDSKLADGGESLVLVNADGEILLDFRYNDKEPWPEAADGDGQSLVFQPLTEDADPADAIHWVASLDPGGYPGHGGFGSYEDWQQHYFMADSGDGGALEDPDGDALPNLLEYVFGSHPWRPSEKTDFLTFKALPDGSKTFTFLRRPAMHDVRFSVEWSADMIAWSAVDVDGDHHIVTPNVRDREEVAVAVEDGNAPFARLVVERVSETPEN